MPKPPHSKYPASEIATIRVSLISRFGPLQDLSNRQKTQIIDQVRAEQDLLPKSARYPIGKLLEAIDLVKPTYYDERKRIANHVDKYAEAKQLIQEIVAAGTIDGHRTLGYRRVREQLDQRGIHLAGATVAKLMKELDLAGPKNNRNPES